MGQLLSKRKSRAQRIEACDTLILLFFSRMLVPQGENCIIVVYKIGSEFRELLYVL